MYIKREDAIRATANALRLQKEAGFDFDAENLINAIPSADVVERKRGEWNKPDYGMCSNCHKYAIEDEGGFYFSDYCPHCGASMVAKQTERSEG